MEVDHVAHHLGMVVGYGLVMFARVAGSLSDALRQNF